MIAYRLLKARARAAVRSRSTGIRSAPRNRRTMISTTDVWPVEQCSCPKHRKSPTKETAS